MGKRRRVERKVQSSKFKVQSLNYLGTSKTFFLAAFLLGLLIRIYFIFLRKYPTGDEIWAYFLIKQDLLTIWYSGLSDFHAPFYFLALSFIGRVFNIGFDIFFLRIISLFFGLLSVFVIFRLARKIYGEKVANIAYFLSLFSPVLIWSSIFARYYSFLIFFVALACFVFIKFCQKSKNIYLLLLMLICAVGIYTHYYFIMIIAAFNIFLVFFKRILLFKFLVFNFLTGIFCLPLFYFFITLPKAEIAGRLINDIVKIPASFVSNIVSWEVLLFIYKTYNFFAAFIFLSVLGMIFLILLSIFLKSKEHFSKLFLIIFFLPLVFGLLYAYLIDPLFSLSALSIFSPAMILILAYGISRLAKKRYLYKILILVFGIFLITFDIFLGQSSATYKNLPNDFISVSREFRKGDLILHSHIYSYIMGNYYFGEDYNWGMASAYSATIYSEKALGYKLIDSNRLENAERIWIFDAPWDNRSEVLEFKKTVKEKFGLFGVDRIDSDNKFQENDFDVYLFVRK